MEPELRRATYHASDCLSQVAYHRLKGFKPDGRLTPLPILKFNVDRSGTSPIGQVTCLVSSQCRTKQSVNGHRVE